jgi:hypothetical protein
MEWEYRLVVTGAGFFLTIILSLGVIIISQEARAKNWCSSHGLVSLTSDTPRLCYDEKTRLVYRPE